MSRCLSRTITVGLLTLSFGCGGASEQRVKALEAEVQKMKEATAAVDSGSQSEATQEKIATIESATDARLKKMEEMLEVLQREVTRVANAGPEGAKPASPDPWHDVDAVLGVEAAPVNAEDNTYTVNRVWLLRQVRALALGSKTPTFSQGKKGGVSVKGFRPKEMLGLLGLKNNDLIRAIGDSEVNSPAEISAALRAADSPLQVKIQRKKKDVTLEYVLAN